ncbi:hypothetical protein ACQP1O_20855 [Nocardia sp. CA-151230]|uniref:hypothetical protein n=1 Tax=Nocardia sp. CA-151230 TaxID=3239982 RepID=UPI003D90DC7E
MSGPRSVQRFAPLADERISTGPEAVLVEAWHRAHVDDSGPATSRVTGQLPISWDVDRDKAIARARVQFRWSAGGWDVNASLPTPAGFAAATQFVRPHDITDTIACGPDLGAVLDAVRPFQQAGNTDIALVQVGDEQQDRFLAEAAQPLLTELRAVDG